jgi:hypothetical protein
MGNDRVLLRKDEVDDGMIALRQSSVRQRAAVRDYDPRPAHDQVRPYPCFVRRRSLHAQVESIGTEVTQKRKAVVGPVYPVR